MAWLLIAMNTQGELEIAFKDLFNNESVLKLYGHEDSYLWKNRKELTDMIKVLKKKDLKIQSSKLLGKYGDHIKEKIKDVGPAAAIKILNDKKDSTSSEEEEKMVKKNERPLQYKREPNIRRNSMTSDKMLTVITSRVKKQGDQELD